MRNVRIYKDEIRTHVLRSLFFTDTALAILGAGILACTLYVIFQYGLHFFLWEYYICALVISEITFFGIITHKIDNQAIYKIAPRAVTLKTNKKEFRHSNLDPYFTDFIVQDNHIIRKDSIVRIYKIEPFDIALLNTQDREHFFLKLKQVIHTLPSQIQLIVRKEKATVADYSQHFFSLYDHSTNKREPVISEYISELSSFIEQSQPLLVKHYAVFSVSCNSKNTDSKVKAMKKLDDMGNRFGSSLHACNIQIQALDNTELISFMQVTLR